jgi:hypothetical protein
VHQWLTSNKLTLNTIKENWIHDCWLTTTHLKHFNRSYSQTWWLNNKASQQI